MPYSPRPACIICGEPRTVHDVVRGPTCSDQACIVAVVKERKAKEFRALEKKRNDLVARIARDADPDAIPARIPYLGQGVADTPDSVKLSFRKNLRTAMRETYQKADAVEVDAVVDADTPDNPVLNASCIACRGYCCPQGGDHAFLNPTTLPTLLAGRSTESPAAIYRDYVRRIPTTSIEGSCLFHGERGCQLPREMRSTICNRFECKDRRELKAELAERPDASAVVVGLADDTPGAIALAVPGKPLQWIEPEPYAPDLAQSQ